MHSWAACALPSYEDFQVFTHMASKSTVNKSECCRRFGWSRYQFDLNAFAGMPVVEAARDKGAEWRVDPKAVAHWVAERKAEEIARQRRLQEACAARKREAERKVVAMLARKYDQERAQREAAKRREAEWREREAKRQRGQPVVGSTLPVRWLKIGIALPSPHARRHPKR